MNEWMENGCGLIDADEEVVYVYHNQTETVHKRFDTPPGNLFCLDSRSCFPNFACESGDG